MKRILLFVFLATLISCGIDNVDEPSFSLEILPIESVEIPDQFRLGQTESISISYIRPNGCYQFNSFIFQNDNFNTRTVSVVDTFFLNQVCTQETEIAVVSFNFTPVDLDIHVFQFFQGQDDQGQDQYLIVEIPVVE